MNIGINTDVMFSICEGVQDILPVVDIGVYHFEAVAPPEIESNGHVNGYQT